jgi:ABC-type antimicrobial peptide transport system permease subunit
MDGLTVKVTGILNNTPPNTDFPIKTILSYASLRSFTNVNSWGNIDDDNYCMVQLAGGYTPQQLQPLFNRFVDKHIKPVNPGYGLALQPLSTIHFDARYGNFNGRTFSNDLILALSLIGLFLLIVACVNFINLTTAWAINRAKEVGVRKVLGGNRAQLMLQFLGETGITCLLALLASAAVVAICIPLVNNLLNIHIATTVLYSGRVLAFMLATLAVVTVLSGFYPALVLSGFKSITVLKSAVITGQGKGISFRRALVVFQFVIAHALIIATLIVASQMDYFRTADMGFNKQAIINAGFPNDSLGLTKMDALRGDLLKIAGIENVSFSMASPATGGGNYTDLRTPANHSQEPDMIVNIKPADTGFFRLYSLPLAAGRVYNASDTMHEFVVNETVVKKLGIQHAQDAVGKMINVNGATLQIVGVVKDFHVNSLRDPIDPVVLTTMKRAYGLVNVKINLRQATAVIAAMENTWNRYFADYTFEYSFLDQDIANFYQQENQLAQLYKIFSGMAIFISCLGLYGLISFMAVQRKKEIGIRKVLGAPVRDIVIMLSKEFTILITIAFVIATPVAWYFMHQWLQQYTYRIVIGIWFFGATIIGCLCVAWLTVGYTAIKAALANPAKSLRTE